jgi:hypothetical protein
VLDVDLTVPIAILATAVVIVIGIRAWASAAERRTAERTEALVRELGLGSPHDGAAEDERASEARPHSAGEAPKA